MTSIRPAESHDADAIAAMFLACWRTSYGAVLPAALVESMTDARARHLWTTALAAPQFTILLATEERAESRPNEVLGLVGFRSEADGTGYVSSLYVSPETQGTGLGGRLLRTAEAALLERGNSAATLWVFAQNRPSIRFYERHGWRLDGREATLPEWGEPQLGMSKRLDEGVS